MISFLKVWRRNSFLASKPIREDRLITCVNGTPYDCESLFVRSHVSFMVVAVSNCSLNSQSWILVVAGVNPLTPIFVAFFGIFQDLNCNCRDCVGQALGNDVSTKPRMPQRVLTLKPNRENRSQPPSFCRGACRMSRGLRRSRVRCEYDTWDDKTADRKGLRCCEST